MGGRRELTPVEAAVERAMARRDREQAQERARVRVAGLRAAMEAARLARGLDGGGWCLRCGDQYPERWSDAMGVVNLPHPCCARCADPQAGREGEGWTRPVLSPEDVGGVLLSRLLGLPVDVPWLAGWGRDRFGLTFAYAQGPQEPWAHVDVAAWAEVGRRAADRQRAFGGPHVPKDAALPENWEELVRQARQHRHSLLGAGVVLVRFTEAGADEEEARVQARLAVLDAEAAAKVARVEADAAAVERSRVRYELGREFRAAQAERERQFRALMATG